MDITITPTITNTNTTATSTPTSTKSPDHDSETPTRIPAAKPLSYSNGFLKRHPPPPPPPHHHHNNHNHNHHLSSAPVPIIYKECLKNHAATLGGHALDGCGEFMPSPSATATDPSSIKCAACGCHRNFHRREPEEPIATTHVIEYQPHHRHHPPPPPPPLPPFQVSNRSPNSASPPPISSSYYPSAPHMLLALSAAPENAAAPANNIAIPSPNGRKRFRTKFTQDQKEKMYQFAEKVGWKMQKRDDDLVHDFCNEIGVDRSVLKVWMHNNKNTFGKRDPVSDGANLLEQQDPINVLPAEIHVSNSNGNATAQDPNHHVGYGNDNSAVNLGGTNGSSSSS